MNSHVVIGRLRGYPTARVAARVRLLCIAGLALLPAPWSTTGRSWPNESTGSCTLVELAHPHGPHAYLYRPIDGRITEWDAIFSAASFAHLFGLDWFAVESWLWTGRASTPEALSDSPRR